MKLWFDKHFAGHIYVEPNELIYRAAAQDFLESSITEATHYVYDSDLCHSNNGNAVKDGKCIKIKLKYVDIPLQTGDK